MTVVSPVKSYVIHRFPNEIIRVSQTIGSIFQLPKWGLMNTYSANLWGDARKPREWALSSKPKQPAQCAFVNGHFKLLQRHNFQVLASMRHILYDYIFPKTWKFRKSKPQCILYGGPNLLGVGSRIRRGKNIVVPWPTDRWGTSHGDRIYTSRIEGGEKTRLVLSHVACSAGLTWEHTAEILVRC